MQRNQTVFRSLMATAVVALTIVPFGCEPQPIVGPEATDRPSAPVDIPATDVNESHPDSTTEVPQ
jgi:hypothetical protein